MMTIRSKPKNNNSTQNLWYTSKEKKTSSPLFIVCWLSWYFTPLGYPRNSLERYHDNKLYDELTASRPELSVLDSKWLTEPNKTNTIALLQDVTECKTQLLTIWKHLTLPGLLSKPKSVWAKIWHFVRLYPTEVWPIYLLYSRTSQNIFRLSLGQTGASPWWREGWRRGGAPATRSVF